MRLQITELEWHDAVLSEIRMESGVDSFDTITLMLQSAAFVGDFGKEDIAVTIKNCFKVKATLNLWIKGKDTISDVILKKSSEWIDEERKQFKDGYGTKQLLHFSITMNTNSRIDMLLTQEDSFTCK